MKGKSIVLDQIKARHPIDAYIAAAQFATCAIVNFMKRRTLSMIIDVKLYKWTLQKLLCLFD